MRVVSRWFLLIDADSVSRRPLLTSSERKELVGPLRGVYSAENFRHAIFKLAETLYTIMIIIYAVWKLVHWLKEQWSGREPTQEEQLHDVYNSKEASEPIWSPDASLDS